MKIKDTSLFTDLKQQWLAITAKWSANIDTRLQVFDLLLASYTAPNRYYHDISHIQHMLILASELKGVIEDQQAFYFAIWFHDAIQLQGKDSEGLSSQLATHELAKINVPKKIIDKVNAFILATKHHQGGSDENTDLFLDVDLSILAANRTEYQAYANNCKKEYLIPSIIYKAGRKKFLKSLIRREFIFNTRLFQVNKEQAARGNIEWELETL